MKLLHNIGQRIHSNYNSAREIAEYRGDISFDGIYLNVLENQEAIAEWRKRNPTARLIFFVQGHTIGGDNAAEVAAGFVPKLERFCTLEQVQQLASELRGEIGWHTHNHPRLTDCQDDTIRRELACPFPTKLFAYPCGNVDERVARLVREAGYSEAFSVTQGDGSQFQKKRSYLNW